jgi:hypothetical protein
VISFAKCDSNLGFNVIYCAFMKRTHLFAPFYDPCIVASDHVPTAVAEFY